jgi:uncharacterized protein (UPF0332 family)
MSLQDWLNEKKISPHTTNPKEIENLFKVIDRDIADAGVTAISADRRFATAYNAALQLATVVLLASGFRVTASKGHHFVTLSSLPFTMGKSAVGRSNYLNTCRHTRNKTDYDRAGVTEEQEVEILLEEVTEFRRDVLDWLSLHHPELSESVKTQ